MKTRVATAAVMVLAGLLTVSEVGAQTYGGPWNPYEMSAHIARNSGYYGGEGYSAGYYGGSQPYGYSGYPVGYAGYIGLEDILTPSNIWGGLGAAVGALVGLPDAGIVAVGLGSWLFGKNQEAKAAEKAAQTPRENCQWTYDSAGRMAWSCSGAQQRARAEGPPRMTFPPPPPPGPAAVAQPSAQSQSQCYVVPVPSAPSTQGHWQWVPDPPPAAPTQPGS